MMWLYIGAAYCAGIVSGLALWEFYGLPQLERKHLAELRYVVAQARLQLFNQRRAMETALRAWRQ